MGEAKHMSYNYSAERAALFTEAGLKNLLKVRDKVNHHINLSGAFRLEEAHIVSWDDIACVDYMVELGELVEFPRECWGQYRVFTTPKVHNL
jgi:hypothetical protein